MCNIYKEANIFYSYKFVEIIKKDSKIYMKMLIAIILKWCGNGWFLCFLFASPYSVRFFRDHVRKKKNQYPERLHLEKLL